ncbi:MAG TPA: HemK2/MTQ2 family protein methyltransferase [Candidatus Saccharimonadales bacterium]|nr:HemK2/MTQ2 family protein methyltransferase [Candidatus Saccharimonadales bacterium]
MEYRGLIIATSPKVYEPAEDSFLAAEVVSGVLPGLGREARVLDVGTGTGVLGLVASMDSEVVETVFSDVNADAVELARTNFQANRTWFSARGSFLRSDLLSGIAEGEMFDLIIFNAPYLRNENEGEERERNAWSGGKEGVELSIKFLEEATPHLAEDGAIVLVASSFSNLEKLMKAVERLGLSISSQAKRHIFFEDIICLDMRMRRPGKM